MEENELKRSCHNGSLFVDAPASETMIEKLMQCEGSCPPGSALHEERVVYSKIICFLKALRKTDVAFLITMRQSWANAVFLTAMEVRNRNSRMKSNQF